MPTLHPPRIGSAAPVSSGRARRVWIIVDWNVCSRRYEALRHGRQPLVLHARPELRASFVVPAKPSDQ